MIKFTDGYNNVITSIEGYKGFKRSTKNASTEAYCLPYKGAKPFIYRTGGTYTIKKEIELCYNGFHFCRDFSSVNIYYRFLDNKNVYARVSAIGKVIDDTDLYCRKSVTNKIKIESEFYPFYQFLDFINYPYCPVNDIIKKAIFKKINLNRNIQKNATICEAGFYIIKKTFPYCYVEYKIVNCTGKRLRKGWNVNKYNIVIKKYNIQKAEPYIVEIQNK